MPIYNASTKIKSNVSSNSLLYDLSIYRVNGKNEKYYLLPPVTKQSLQSNYETQYHKTVNTDDPLTTIYMVELMLYRKHFLNTYPALDKPFIRMYTLEEIISGKACSENKRENACYFESTGESKPMNEGDNTITLSITIPERPFIAKEYPIGHPKDPFEKKRIENEIDDRFYYFSYPYQDRASVCGPAAFFYCLQMDRPDVYAQAARELWQYGTTTIGELTITPSEKCKHPSGIFFTNTGEPRILGIDWMTLVGLRDSENTIFSFDSLDSPVAGITMWNTLTEWFEKAGYELVFKNAGITQAGIEGIRELNKYIKKGYKVVTLINDGLLEGSTTITTIPTHWIVWNSAVTQDDNGYVKLELFSWGQSANWLKKEKDIQFFINRFFGGMVFKPLK